MSSSPTQANGMIVAPNCAAILMNSAWSGQNNLYSSPCIFLIRDIELVEWLPTRKIMCRISKNINLRHKKYNYDRIFIFSVTLIITETYVLSCIYWYFHFWKHGRYINASPKVLHWNWTTFQGGRVLDNFRFRCFSGAEKLKSQCKK